MKENEFNERADQAMRDAARLGETPASGVVSPGVADDVALGRLLAKMPAGPRASSNFTARVLLEIDAIERKDRAHKAGGKLSWMRWLSWGAATALIALVAVRVGKNHPDAAMTQGLETVAMASAVIESKGGVSGQPQAVRTLEVWKDFEAIRKLNQPAVEADWALLAALQ